MKNGEAATDKQKKLAEWIANTLGVPLPKVGSRESYHDFIATHKTEFEDKLEDNNNAKWWADGEEYGSPEVPFDDYIG